MMDYIVGLKKELDFISQEQAEHRYLELMAMGYPEDEIAMAAPVPVQVNVDIGSVTPMNSNYANEPAPHQPVTVNPT